VVPADAVQISEPAVETALAQVDNQPVDGEFGGETTAASRQPHLATLEEVRRFQAWMVRRLRDGDITAEKARNLRRLVLDVKETIIAGHSIAAGLPAPPGGPSTVVNFNTVVAAGSVSRIGELLAALAGARAEAGAQVLDADGSVVPVEGGPGA
jgi:hypothetical protein